MLDLSNVARVSDAPFEFGPIQTKWLEALESGKYRQGQGCLRSETSTEGEPPRFCCLGVLCEVMGLEYNKDDFSRSIGYHHAGFASNGNLPHMVSTVVGLHGSHGMFKRDVTLPPSAARSGASPESQSCLANMNDTGAYSFAEIAQYIRHDPHNVFSASL